MSEDKTNIEDVDIDLDDSSNNGEVIYVSTIRVPTTETVKRKTIKDMKELGTHRPQYNRLIDIYADLIHRYYKALQDFELSGSLYETSTAAGNPKKSSIISTLENLRKDIYQLSDRLMLNPKSMKDIQTEEEKPSDLELAIGSLDFGT